MLGTLGEADKVKWSEWVPSMTHAYNGTKCQVTGFTPYFLMFGHEPILAIDLEYGITNPMLVDSSHENFAKKLRKRLQWAYKVANECIQKEAMYHKKYYDKRMRCMKLDINDVVLMRVKAFGNDRKVADKWEEHPYHVVEQLPNRPVFKVQNLEDMTKFHILHRNMLFPLRTAKRMDDEPSVLVEHVNVQLLQANKLMEQHFYSL